jgi:hypothetical protein
MDIELPEAEIFDADGTLWDVRGIRHYVTPPRRDFHAFHMASLFCPPNSDVIADVHTAVAKGRVPLLVTARQAQYRAVTQRWLERHQVPIVSIWMRANGDLRKDYVIKKEILDKIRLQYRVVKATDDNPAVIELWENEGIPYRLVPGWDDQFTGLAPE